MFNLLRKKQKTKEITPEKPIEKFDVGQVTIILNGKIHDNFMTDTNIKDWKYNPTIILSPLFEIDKEGKNSIDYFLKPEVTEIFIQDHEHVVLHCTVPDYLFEEIIRK